MAAGAVRRGLGFVVDQLIFALVSTLIAVVVGFGRPDRAVSVAFLSGDTAYLIGALALWGRTIGMAAVGVRAVAADGSAPGWRRSVVRWSVPDGLRWITVLLPISGARTVVGWAGWALMLATYLCVLARADRRGLHDLAADVTVICRPRRSALPEIKPG